MGNTTKSQKQAEVPHSEDLILGKRHTYQRSETRSFLSTAAAIGFSKEEMKRLGRVYLGVDENDPQANGKADLDVPCMSSKTDIERKKK